MYVKNDYFYILNKKCVIVQMPGAQGNFI
jgi:hypothetical protein